MRGEDGCHTSRERPANAKAAVWDERSESLSASSAQQKRLDLARAAAPAAAATGQPVVDAVQPAAMAVDEDEEDALPPHLRGTPPPALQDATGSSENNGTIPGIGDEEALRAQQELEQATTPFMAARRRLLAAQGNSGQGGQEAAAGARLGFRASEFREAFEERWQIIQRNAARFPADVPCQLYGHCTPRQMVESEAGCGDFADVCGVDEVSCSCIQQWRDAWIIPRADSQFVRSRNGAIAMLKQAQQHYAELACKRSQLKQIVLYGKDWKLLRPGLPPDSFRRLVRALVRELMRGIAADPIQTSCSLAELNSIWMARHGFRADPRLLSLRTPQELLQNVCPDLPAQMGHSAPPIGSWQQQLAVSPSAESQASLQAMLSSIDFSLLQAAVSQAVPPQASAQQPAVHLPMKAPAQAYMQPEAQSPQPQASMSASVPMLQQQSVKGLRQPMDPRLQRQPVGPRVQSAPVDPRMQSHLIHSSWPGQPPPHPGSTQAQASGVATSAQAAPLYALSPAATAAAGNVPSQP
ncbi:hypothetical protein WJX72_003053 [[Myrmecia] bisecta]|uniref:Uncharacterized protein n=1 Tax=[Myrmecia] bisecta TaxID=41462 RepID=A0AAW1PPI5_9CHLO